MLSSFLRAGLVIAALTLFAPPTHAQLAEGHSKFFGSIGKGKDSPRPIDGFDALWNQVTVENAGKWRNPEPARDQMNWDVLDYWYGYTQDRGFPFKQHTFVWGYQQPDWIDALPPAEQRAEVEEWIRLYFERYPNTAFVDVVNEPIPAPPGYRDALGGAGETGWDWVIWTFEKAKQYRDLYAPGAELHLNDYDILKNSGKRATYLGIIGLLQDRGLIDGIGVQGHFLEGTSPSAVQNALDELAATGLPVYVSELDLNFSGDQAQLAKYQALFPVLWEHPAVAGITLWGYRENAMWRDDAYLVRADGTERPALTWLRDYLAVDDPDGGPTEATYPAEAAALAGGATLDANHGGFRGAGFVNFPTTGGTATFDVDGGAGGPSVLAFRYALAGGPRTVALEVGGTAEPLAFEPTGSWATWATREVEVSLAPGTNAVRLRSTGEDGPNVDELSVSVTAPDGEAVVVRALGRRGTERMELRIGGQTVAAWTVGTAFADYAYETTGPVDASDVSVAFVNDDAVGDGTGRDLRVDRVTVGGVAYESEAPSTYSTGTWASGSGCAGGYKQREWLHCNGAFSYDQSGAALRATAPDAPALEAFPNPAPGQATVAFTLADAAGVELAVYDVLGRRVALLAEGAFDAGHHEVAFDGTALPPGLYLVRLTTGTTVRTQRITLAR